MIIFLIIIIIILILLIINQCANNYADSHTKNKFEIFKIEEYNLQKNLQVEKIGICYSLTTYLPYEIYTLGHEDILCKCSNGKWYLLAEIYDKNDILGKKQHIIGLREIEIRTKKNFNFNGYKYTYFKLYSPNCYVDLEFVYNVFKEGFKIPYHVLKNNCHHTCNRVLNIITGQKRKQYISEFKTLNYLKKTIFEVINKHEY